MAEQKLSSIFVEYSCGCKGIRLDRKVPEGERLAGFDLMICIKPCDLDQCDHYGPYFYVREQDLEHKAKLARSLAEDTEDHPNGAESRPFRYLTVEEELEMIQEVRQYVADGHSLREVRRLLS